MLQIGFLGKLKWFASAVKASKVFKALKFIGTIAALAVGVKGFLQAREMLAKGQDIMANKTAAGGKIPVIYGTRRVGAQIVYMDTAQNRSKDLFVVYAIAVGECEEILGKTIEIDGNSILDGKIYKGGGYVGSDKITSGAGSLNTASQVGDNQYSSAGNLGTDPTLRYSFVFNLHHGAASQTADPMLRASIPNQWSTSHKLNGICYIAASFDYDKKGMYQGVPQITVQVRGKKVYDPRDTNQTFGDASTFTWSSNPALCYLDYITNDEYGKGLAETDINMTTFQSAANACDTLVDQPYYNGSYQNVTWSGTSGNDFITVDDNDDWYQNKVDEVIDIRDNGGSNIFSGVDIKGIKRDEFYDTTQSNKIYIDGTLSSNYTNEAGSFRAKVKRFHCNGYIDTNKNVMDNAKELLANMRGIFTYINGKYELQIEDTGSSTFSITEDHIIGDAGITVDYGNKDKKANKVIVEFFNSQQNYELDTVTVLHNASPNYYSDDGEVLEIKAEFPLVTDYYIAHNMAKAILTRSRNQTTMQFLGTPEMYKLNVGDIVDLTYAGLGFSGKVCRVEALELQSDGLVSVSLIEYFDVYTWQVPAQEDTRKLLKIPTVGALHPPEANTIVFADTDASNINRPKLTWTEPTDFPVRQYRVDVVDSLDNNVFSKIVDTPSVDLSFLPKASNYEAQITAFNGVGIESEAVTKTFTIADDPVKTTEVEINGVTLSSVETYGTVTGKTGNYVKFTNKTDFEEDVVFDGYAEFRSSSGARFDGDVDIVGAGLTVQDIVTASAGLQIDSSTPASTTNKLYNASGTLYWNGNQVGVGAINSVTNMANNRVITASGSNSLNGEANFTFDGTTLTVTGDQVITGNLTVQGTTTTIDTTNLDVKDKNITLNYGTGDTSGNADGAGITIQDAVSATQDATILWNATNDEFDFSHGITLPDNAKATFGTGGDLEIYHSGSDSIIKELGVGGIKIDSNYTAIRSANGSETSAKFLENGAVELYYDNNKKFETTSSGIDVTGTTVTDGIDTSNHIYIDNDRDINFRNVDGNTDGTYLTRATGNATRFKYTGNAFIFDSTGNKDWRIYNSSGDFVFSVVGMATPSNSSTRVYGKLQIGTTTVIDNARNLVNIASLNLDDNKMAIFGNGDDLQIYHDGSHSYIKEAGIGNLQIQATGSTFIKSSDGTKISAQFVPDSYTRLYHNNARKLDTATDGIDISGVAATTFGLNIIDPSASAYGAHFSFDDTNSKVLIGGVTNGTKNTAISIPRDSTQVDFQSHITLPDDARIKVGASSDLQIYHDGSNSYITDTGTGDLLIQSNSVRLRATSGENMLRALENGAVELYYDNSKKLETTSSGIDVSGRLDVAQDIRLRGNSSTSDVGVASISIADAAGSINFDAGNDGTNMSLTSTGLGIGTSSPSSKLHVKLSGNADDSISLVESSGSANYGVYIKSTYAEEMGRVGALNQADGGLTGASISFKDYGRDIVFNTHEGASNSEKVRIKKSGYVGIGTSSPNAPLHVESSLDYVANFKSTDTTAGILLTDSNGQCRVTNTNGNLILSSDINNEVANSAIRFMLDTTSNAGGSAKVVIREAGLGINTASPSNPLHVYHATTDTVARFESGDASVAVNFIASNNSMQIATSGTDGIIKNNGAGNFRFFNNGSERVRIDSSGNLLVGKTTSSTGVAGARFSANGFANVTRDGAECINFNRLTSDGTIIDLRKDSVTVGSIGANAGVMTLASPNGNKHYVANSALFPSANNIIDLGTGSQGYKDLHLSGTANVGQITVDSRLVIDGSKIYDTPANGNNKGFGIGGAGLVPVNGSGTNTTNLVDIGTSSYKFKDLWLSGTMNANAISISGTGTTTLGGALNVQGNINTDSGFIQVGGTTVIDDSRNLTNIGTVSSGVTTITSSGTIGGNTPANGYLKITDSTNTLAFDANEIHTTDNLYLNAEDGIIYLRGNDSGAVTLKNGGITFMTTTRDLQNIGNINAGTNLYLGNANKTRISSDNNGEVAINYATTTGTTASSLGIYNNTTRTVTLKRDGSVISSGGTSYFPKLESPEYRNTTIVSNATTPTNTAGWFKIAKVTRGAGKILLSFTGGNYSPDTYVIEYFKNWSSIASLTLKQFGNSSFITKAKIRQDSSDNNYYVEIYCSSNSNGLNFQVYHQRLSGFFQDTNIVYGGSLTAGSTSGTDYVTEKFFEGYGGVTLQEFRADKYQGDINIHNGTLKINTTTVIDASRNLTNIGTISSGTITSTGNVNCSTVNSTGQIQTGYGVKFDNGATDFLLYNNPNENQLYMRDITNGEMLTTWYTTYFKVNKDLDVTGVIKSNGTTFLDASRNLTNIGTVSSGAITSTGDASITGNLSTTGGITVGDSSADALRFVGVLKQGSGSGTTVMDASRNLTNIAGITLGDSHLIGDDSFDNLALVSSSGENIVVGANNDIYFTTGATNLTSTGTTRLIVKNDGKVGIGTVSPTEKLHVEGNIELQNNGYIGSLDGNYWQRIRFEDNTPSSTNAFNFETRNGSGSFINHMTITNNGDIGIGTSSPARTLHVNNNGESFIRITSSNTGNAGLEFGDQSDGVQGAIYQNSTDNSLRFNGYNNAERMRIDSSGNLLVGTTNDFPPSDSGNEGVAIKPDNIAISRNASTALFLDRMSSDGNIIDFRKDNTNVGSIAVDTNDNLVIEGNSTHSGLQFGTATLLPHQNGGLTNRVIDIGNSSYRFKNFNLGGSIDLNTGSGSTNALLFFNNSVKNGWIGIPAWDNQSLRAYAPSPVSGNNNEPAFKYGSGSWTFWTDFNNTSGSGSTSAALFISTGGSVNIGRGNLQMGGTTVIDSSRQFTTYSRLTFGYNSHYFEAGTNSISFKNSSGTSRFTSSDTGFTVTTNLTSSGRIQSNGSTAFTANGSNVILRTIAPAVESGHTTKHEMNYGWASTNDRTYQAPKIDGTPNYSHEFGYNFASENWYFEDELSVGSINTSGAISSGDIATTGIDCSGQITSGSIEAEHTKSSTTNPIINIVNGSSSNEGYYAKFTRSGGTLAGVIGRKSQTESNIYIATSDVGLKMESYITYKAVVPCNTDGTDVDNAIDLGNSSTRFDDIYATNGTIQTSDKNEKQDIQELSEAEQKVAIRCKGLIRRYKFNSAVEEKGDDARYHFGIIAQDLKDAFEAEGLDAGAYGMFISETWTNDEGQEQTRLGVRYNELLAFIIATL